MSMAAMPDPGPLALADVKTWLRLTTSADDAFLADAIVTALDLCESFTAQVMLVRSGSELLTADPCGAVRISAAPVLAVTAVHAVADDASETLLAPTSYVVEIDEGGVGRVRGAPPFGTHQLRVDFNAGLAADWPSLPAAIRQGVLREAAHIYAMRGTHGEAVTPAAALALWRPYRSLRL